MRDAGPRRPAEGFTLLEVLLATVVIATAALIAFPTLVSFFDLSNQARDSNIATRDLNAATEDLIATPFGQITATYVAGEPIPKYTDLHLSDERIVVNYDDPAADPLLITLTASWTDRKGRPCQEVFRCMRTP